ncbi:MAG: threonine dehydratase [Chloroflexota bacterium]|nr:threonine dehydratase [Chloroflexota bacterium]
MRDAAARTAGLPATPLVAAGPGAWLKLETLQPTGSFKVRGFTNAVALLSPAERRAGIVTVSAGNAALAAAYVARENDIPCKVVMFDTAPPPKRVGVERLGAEVIAMPRIKVLDWMALRGYESMAETFIHPFANEAVMAGHASLGLELAEQLPGLTRVVVPVGGGGLIVGIASGLAAAGRDVEVVGVQSDGYDLWVRTMAEGTAPALTPATIADGTAGPDQADMHARLAGAVDRWLTVPEGRLRRAVAELATNHRVVAEGAGALGFAGAMELADPLTATVGVVSGGNIDPRLLAALLQEANA